MTHAPAEKPGLNIGVVGCGTVAGYGHMPAIAASKHWRLLAVSDLDERRLAKVAGQYRPAHAFKDYRELVALKDLDAVVVSTFMQAHHAVTLAALASGKHVFCEKPMAETVEQCREMVDAAGKAGRLLAINFNPRTARVYLEVKRLIDEGAVGAVRVVRFVYDWSCHQWQPPERLDQRVDRPRRGRVGAPLVQRRGLLGRGRIEGHGRPAAAAARQLVATAGDAGVRGGRRPPAAQARAAGWARRQRAHEGGVLRRPRCPARPRPG